MKSWPPVRCRANVARSRHADDQAKGEFIRFQPAKGSVFDIQDHCNGFAVSIGVP
jgi:hypothetical protein